ncbi:E3 ubiquitin-protein ligase TRIM63 [Dissostichus eleginoides]|uniref:Tripartite motif-containing protein 54 n=1 Tax=Dissostichus eleginoides TaxID=100907 RepID=A0AAD9B3T9_DISEL|nr:E3 ubiquitin-protein ligase TRIM63 [Dissostichus eleginoides]
MDIVSAVRSGSAMESLEQQLSCPICLEMFTKPVVILPCQHNLCRGCANDLFESRNAYHYSGGTFRCPTCRHEVVLDRHGVFGLQRNLLVENIIDMYKQQQEGKGQLEEEEEVRKKEVGDEPRCREHEEEKINIYCVTCQTPTCSMCKVFGAHKDCEVAPLLSVYNTQKAEMRVAVETLAASSAALQAAVAQMDDACSLIVENGERQRRRLGESLDLLYAILEEKKGELLENIGREERERVAKLNGVAALHRQQLQLSAAMQEKLTASMQTQCSAASFLLDAKTLREEAELVAGGAPPKGPEPGVESLDHMTIDTSEAQRLLSAMEFSRE